MLLSYDDPTELRGGGQRWRGETQLELLTAITTERRTAAVRARIDELERKFPHWKPSEPHTYEVGNVTSPIAPKSANRMTDEQWICAMAKYSGEERFRSDGAIIGGADELSQVLERCVRTDPRRFARLVLRLPDEIHAAYFAAILRGLDDARENPQDLFEACRRVHRLPNHPCGDSICHLVEKLGELAWPEDIIDIIAWYAVHDPDPSQDLWQTEASSGGTYYGGDIYTNGINTVRGAGAGAVRALLFGNSERKNALLPTIQRMVLDPSIAVRSCVATTLLPLLNDDRDQAVALFEKLCDTDDALLKTNFVEEFLCHANTTHYETLRPIVLRMIHSADDEVALAGARQACLVAIDDEHAENLIITGDDASEPLRTGAAQVFAANLRTARFRSKCQAGLSELLNDASEKVRAAASDWLRSLQDDQLGEFVELIQDFTTSLAFEDHHESLIHALTDTTARLPTITLDVCQRFLQIAGEAAGDPATRAAFDAISVSDLLVRVYHQSDDDQVTRRCLDLIDNMFELQAAGIGDAISKLER